MQKIIYNYHNPVLLRATVEGIITTHIKDIYVDVTFGSGGHSEALLRRLSAKATLLALEQDQQSIENYTIKDNRLKIIHKNFKHLENILRCQGLFKISGIIADLGISFHQIENTERGFSIRSNQILDMRMDQRIKISAKDIINSYSHKSLTKIFSSYGELTNSKKVATYIFYKRKEKTIENTFELIEILKNNILGRKKQKFIVKVFQALRIEVNDELTSLKYLLLSIINVLKKGCKLAIISYHSLEDRIIKQFLKNGRFENISKENLFGKKKYPFLLFPEKPIFSEEKEIQKNPCSRSARLRIAKKT